MESRHVSLLLVEMARLKMVKTPCFSATDLCDESGSRHQSVCAASNLMRRGIVMAICLTIGIAHAKADPCHGRSDADVEVCLRAGLAEAEAKLARYGAAVEARIARRDRADHAFADFSVSQDSWMKYRAAECRAVYKSWSTETDRIRTFLSCSRRLTQSRLHDIWANWLQPVNSDDPTPPLPEPVMEHFEEKATDVSHAG